jgi:HSP20 family molecular chaperone IbpA
MDHDPTRQMWADACAMLAQAERLQRQFFDLGRGKGQLPTWEPPVDVFESDEEILILVALPGVEPNATSVTLEGEVLSIAATRPVSVHSPRALIHRLEIPHGRFMRQVHLGRRQLELSQQEMRHGCLYLLFRKLD